MIDINTIGRNGDSGGVRLYEWFGTDEQPYDLSTSRFEAVIKTIFDVEMVRYDSDDRTNLRIEGNKLIFEIPEYDLPADVYYLSIAWYDGAYKNTFEHTKIEIQQRLV